jgi:error-prone DNA polymerase
MGRRGHLLAKVPDGRLVRIAGAVIVRQRPGTAHGFVFMSVEDETGIMNAIVAPATFDRYKFVVLAERYLIIHGVLQNLDGVFGESRPHPTATRGRRPVVAQLSLKP